MNPYFSKHLIKSKHTPEPLIDFYINILPLFELFINFFKDY